MEITLTLKLDLRDPRTWQVLKLAEELAAGPPPPNGTARPPAPPPPREAGEDPVEPEHRAPAPATPGNPPMTGNQLLGWIGDRSDARELLKAAQSIGKRLGLGWQVKTWKPDQVQEVYRELLAKHLPAPAREGVRR